MAEKKKQNKLLKAIMIFFTQNYQNQVLLM